MIIAIDGPAAAGKGTLARRLAAHYGLAYLDTGALYRAVALRLLRAGADPADPEAAVAAARAVEAGELDDPALRDEAVGAAASVVAAQPAVRAVLLDFQRHFAAHPPAGATGATGAVLDGRDIGTVVCPDADIKLFVTASPAVRARRRVRELAARGEPADEAEIRREIEARDARDAARATAPLKPAEDGHLLDTSNLDIDSAFEAAKALIARLHP
jgi:cytidylate kinase